jgi:hypothetical protein
MGKSKHPVLNTEKVVHPTTITCKWWDTDHQLVAVCQACITLSAATGLGFHHSNIKHFDDIMPVPSAMKRKSEERLDTAMHRLEEEEENAAKRSDEEEEVAAAAAASAAQWKEMKDAAAAAVVATAAKRKEMKEAVTVTVAAGVLVVAVAVVKRKAFVEIAGSQPSCVLLCSHVRCSKSAQVRGVCKGHGPRCSHVGFIKSVHVRGVCRGHGPRCSHVGCIKSVHVRGVCRGHGPRCRHVGCGKDVYTRNVCKGHGQTKK